MDNALASVMQNEFSNRGFIGPSISRPPDIHSANTITFDSLAPVGLVKKGNPEFLNTAVARPQSRCTFHQSKSSTT